MSPDPPAEPGTGQASASVDDLAARFRRFAAAECGGSPLYRKLAEIAADCELLELAAHGSHGPKPNLFLAAVHDLILRDARSPGQSRHCPFVILGPG